MRKLSTREKVAGVLTGVLAAGALGTLAAKHDVEISGHPLAGSTPVAESSAPATTEAQEKPEMNYQAPVLAQNIKAIYEGAPTAYQDVGSAEEGITLGAELPRDNGITAFISERSLIIDDFTLVNRIEVGQRDPSGIKQFTLTLAKSPDGIWGATCEDGENSLEVNGSFVTLNNEVLTDPSKPDSADKALMTVGRIASKAEEFVGLLHVPGSGEAMDNPTPGLCAGLAAE